MYAASLRLRFFNDIARHRRIVIDRLGVGHAADRRKTAVRRRARAGNDIFLVFLTGIAQMAVHVDKARRDDLARRVVNRRALGRKPLADGRNFSIFNQHVCNPIQTVGRVDHTAAPNQKLFHHAFSLLVSM